MSEVKIFSFEEVQKHNTENDLWMIIDGKVYDCTKFLPEHPGGEEVVVDCGGIDATQAFDDIGHSDDAREQLKDLYIGDIDPESIPQEVKSANASASSSGESQMPLILAIIAVLVAVTGYLLTQKK